MSGGIVSVDDALPTQPPNQTFLLTGGSTLRLKLLLNWIANPPVGVRAARSSLPASRGLPAAVEETRACAE